MVATISFILISIVYFITITITLIINQKQEEKMIEILEFNEKLLEEKTNIIKILINAKSSKENFTLTLQKIEKELIHNLHED